MITPESVSYTHLTVEENESTRETAESRRNASEQSRQTAETEQMCIRDRICPVKVGNKLQRH